MNVKEKYKGVIVPMVSPCNNDYSIDEAAVQAIIDTFILNDVKPFLLGTTGEAPSLSAKQKVDLIKTAYKTLNGKLPLLAGIGSNSLFTAIEEGKKYAGLGVEALVSTVPNYYPSGDTQMINWFEKLADEIPVPLFLYNIPLTTHHSISLNVAEILSHHENIIGIKDSEQNEERLTQSLHRWKDRDDFIFLVGWAAKSAFGLKNGANGIVPSLGNLIPELYSQIVLESEKGNFEAAVELQNLVNTVSAFCQKDRNISHSIPAMKVLMAMKGLCGTQVLPPMMQMDKREESEYRGLMQVAMKKTGII